MTETRAQSKMTIDDCRRHSSTRKKILLLALAIPIATQCAYSHAQAPQSTSTTQADRPAPKLPVYDVVSIKPNKSGGGNYGWRTGDDSFTATNVPLKFLVSTAYDIKEDLISGVSGPIDSARFDVTAKIVEPDPTVMKKLSDKQRQAMLLPVLTERFQLKAHTEIKVLPIYELVIQGGPKFKQSSGSSNQGWGWNFKNNQATLTAHDLSMMALTSILTNTMHRTVIDKTGLTGKYELSLKWSQDVGTSSTTDTDPSIFTALPEQLGLKLKPAKGPVETLVVDHAAMPSAN